MEVNLRELVLDMLMEVNEKNEYSHIVLSGALTKYQYLDKNQRGFVTRLFEGTLERQIELDYIIDGVSKTKVRKMKPLIRNLIRMGTYQLHYMDNVPEAAACNECVKLAKKRGFATLSGFVNGILRNIARNRESYEYPSKLTHTVEYYSIKYALPAELIEMWLEQYGQEVLEQILEGLMGERCTYIRCNTDRITPEDLSKRLEDEGVAVERVDNIEFAYRISGYDYLKNLKSFNEGLFYVQDLSSIIAGVEARPKKGWNVLDVCSAPGGKAMNVALLMEGSGQVTARDVTEYKTSMIQENCLRLGINNVKVQVSDATIKEAELEQQFDLVIADVPCMGLGILARKNDIRHKVDLGNVEEIVKLQRRILENAASYVKKGGVLLFSTCTINRRENQENVEWLIENTSLRPDKIDMSGYGIAYIEDEGGVQLLPSVAGNDGFYIARMIKNT